MPTKIFQKKKFNPQGVKSTPLKVIKPFKFSKVGKSSLKKKIIYKKNLKNISIFLKKKKKLSIIYKIFSLNNLSIYYRLRRKLFKKKLKLQYPKGFLKLRFSLKRLHFLNDTNSVLKFSNLLKTSETISLDTIKEHKFSEIKNNFKFFLSITIHSNNIFINLSKYLKKKIFKTVKFWSAGMFDFICSKTKLKFAISAMFKEVKIQLKQLKIYTIKIKAPKYLNKYIFRQLSRLSYKPKFFIYCSFKIFNGCRSQKKRRKKRLRFRFFR